MTQKKEYAEIKNKKTKTKKLTEIRNRVIGHIFHLTNRNWFPFIQICHLSNNLYENFNSFENVGMCITRYIFSAENVIIF